MVYPFPAGLISREAARFTESFVLTVGVGDDLVMRLSVHSIENLRTKVIQTIHATKLPKVSPAIKYFFSVSYIKQELFYFSNNFLNSATFFYFPSGTFLIHFPNRIVKGTPL